MYKRILVVIGLVGMIGWAIYDSASTSKKQKKAIQETQSVSNKSEVLGIEEGDRAPNF
ncbi:hypothetical protein L1999_06870 [Neobacillus drentensis]|uniref:hypothetical protein n=1 Tax=Neobacillus drentensis TaxID=220684 RepID=UPI001F4531D2|nr:hypothetical protein [Neobacillus drentensis]ULT58239.1 hypothetical protein L1999_06870 [Neobacillus drentensis]